MILLSRWMIFGTNQFNIWLGSSEQRRIKFRELISSFMRTRRCHVNLNVYGIGIVKILMGVANSPYLVVLKK